jgi:hypothetical protein
MVSELAKEKSGHLLDKASVNLMQQIRENVPLLYAILKILPFISDNIFWQEPLPNGKRSHSLSTR